MGAGSAEVNSAVKMPRLDTRRNGSQHFELNCDTQHNDTFTEVSIIPVLIVFLCVIMLSVIMLSVIMLSVIMLSVIMLSVFMLNVIMLSGIMLNVIMPSGIMLSVIMLSGIMLRGIMLSVIWQGYYTEDHYAVIFLIVIALSVLAPKVHHWPCQNPSVNASSEQIILQHISQVFSYPTSLSVIKIIYNFIV
jgi:hypothetical protein